MKFETGVLEAIKEVKGLTQNMFDVLVSFAFNVGLGGFKSSTLLKKVIANPKDKTIADEFNKWVNTNGQKVAGLVSRRAKEAQLYFA